MIVPLDVLVERMIGVILGVLATLLTQALLRRARGSGPSAGTPQASSRPGSMPG